MKKFLSIFLAFVLLFSLFGCAKHLENNQQTKEIISSQKEQNTTVKTDSKYVLNTVEVKTDSHILIAYFSITGSTAQMADFISANTGGAMFELVPVKPYVDEDLDYNASNCRAKTEVNDPNARVKIYEVPSNMDDFDVIYLGYPIWFNSAPKIIHTFLENVDLSGKTIIPFCTSGGSSIEQSIKDIKPLVKDAKWKSGKRFAPNATQSDIDKWLNN